LSNRYLIADHISYPYGDGVYRTLCGKYTYDESFVLPAGNVCKPCHWNEQSDWEDMTVNNMLYNRAEKEDIDPRDERKYGAGGQFDTETYRILFNGFLRDPTELNISCEHSVSEMDNEELTAWIARLEEFVKVAKVAKQAARVTIEDRKLQMTEEQKKKQLELDRKYKPAVAIKAVKTKSGKTPKAKISHEEKLIKTAMDMMSFDETAAIAWLKEKGRL
jgi:hypothetical protein